MLRPKLDLCGSIAGNKTDAILRTSEEGGYDYPRALTITLPRGTTGTPENQLPLISRKPAKEDLEEEEVEYISMS